MDLSKGAMIVLLFELTIGGQSFADEDEEKRFEVKEQDFLFLVEGAYTQKQGEWEIRLVVGYFDNLVEKKLEEKDEEENKGEPEEIEKRTDQWISVSGVEYGVTDRFQIELELPYLRQKVTKDDERETNSGIT